VPVAPAVAPAPPVAPAVAPVAPVISSPAVSTPRVEQPTPAPPFEGGQKISEAKPEASAAERLTDLLSGLLNQPASPGRGMPIARRSWDPRKALVCVPENNRESVARGLTEIGYQVFVAQDTRQAVDRMREAELDVVLLDSRFDPSEQGAIFVTREVNILRPPQRRRLFFVVISPSLRTMDAHAAFLSNVNGIVNINELEELPKLLDRRMREYNDIYKDFNIALGISAL